MSIWDLFHKKQSIDENGAFKSKLSSKYKVGEFEELISKIRMNLANNYKDEAQRGLKSFTQLFQDMKEKGQLNEKQLLVYGEELSALTEKLEGYSHKDQKPYWH